MSEVETAIQISEEADRLKVVIPDRINWLILGLYSIALVTWLVMLVVIMFYLLRGYSTNLVLIVLLVMWIVVWLMFGRFLWRRWQNQAANREILFIDNKQLILRRPVSLIGLTNSYDFKHVSPFYYSDRHHCMAFDYAYLHVYFGHGISRKQANDLIDDLNRRYFPELGEELADI
jgi:hypothetical protein